MQTHRLSSSQRECCVYIKCHFQMPCVLRTRGGGDLTCSSLHCTHMLNIYMDIMSLRARSSSSLMALHSVSVHSSVGYTQWSEGAHGVLWKDVSLYSDISEPPTFQVVNRLLKFGHWSFAELGAGLSLGKRNSQDVSTFTRYDQRLRFTAANHKQTKSKRVPSYSKLG